MEKIDVVLCDGRGPHDAAHACDEARRLRRGLVILCIGGGQGVARALEAAR